MQFSTTLFSATVLFIASQAMGAAVNVPNEVEARRINTATDQYTACNCPNNCGHDVGDSCKFYAGPSDNSDVVHGECEKTDSGLTCLAK